MNSDTFCSHNLYFQGLKYGRFCAKNRFRKSNVNRRIRPMIFHCVSRGNRNQKKKNRFEFREDDGAGTCKTRTTRVHRRVRVGPGRVGLRRSARRIRRLLREIYNNELMDFYRPTKYRLKLARRVRRKNLAGIVYVAAAVHSARHKPNENRCTEPAALPKGQQPLAPPSNSFLRI